VTFENFMCGIATPEKR